MMVRDKIKNRIDCKNIRFDRNRKNISFKPDSRESVS
jgi:hypothetical protein